MCGFSLAAIAQGLQHAVHATRSRVPADAGWTHRPICVAHRSGHVGDDFHERCTGFKDTLHDTADPLWASIAVAVEPADAAVHARGGARQDATVSATATTSLPRWAGLLVWSADAALLAVRGRLTPLCRDIVLKRPRPIAGPTIEDVGVRDLVVWIV